jgi:uncharacterized protein YcgI (DUF1989 family)
VEDRWLSDRSFPQLEAPGLRLARGEHLRIIDLEGGQTGDLMAFSQDGMVARSTTAGQSIYHEPKDLAPSTQSGTHMQRTSTSLAVSSSLEPQKPVSAQACSCA